MATLNAWGFFGDWPNRLRLLARTWPSVNADILLCQEVGTRPGCDQLASLAEHLGYPHAFPVLCHTDDGHSESVAVLSRLPLTATDTIDLPLSQPQRRAARAVAATPDGGSLTVFSAHLSFSPTATAIRQLERLLDEPAPRAVIGGDFNLTPDVVDERARQRGLRCALADTDIVTWPVSREELTAAYRVRFGRAPSFDLGARKVDYLLCRGVDVRAAGAIAVGSPNSGYASDHALAWADLII